DKHFGSPRRPSFTTVDHMTVVDDATVQFALSHPYAPFLTQLETMYIEPNSTDIDFSKTPVGTGPFKFVEWVSGQHIQLAKNPGYWQAGQPYLDGVEFRPIVEPSTRVVDLQSANVDLLNAVPLKDVDTLQHNNRIQVWSVAGVV